MQWALLGLSLGLGAGVSPGPLLALVLSTSLRQGALAGTATALAPLLSDAIVVAVSILAAGLLPSRLLAVAGVAGGIFVIWLGVSAWRDAGTFSSTRADSDQRPAALPRSPARAALARAVAVNVASPHPWVFWLTVGAPLLVTAWRSSAAGAVAFLACFYLLLVGAKVALAVTLGRTRHRLPASALQLMLRISAALLAVAGLALVIEFLPRS